MQPGDLLDDRYRLEAPLGKGGMGEVWRAHDLSRDRPVAVKVMLPTVRDVVDMARFQREAELAAKVDRTAGVVRVHAFGNWRGSPYCVQELVDGGSLKDVFAQSPEPERVAELIAQVARSLAVCHAAGIVHRDLKPDNILLDGDGRPKLADFGLAKDLAGGDEERLTRSAEVLGTPAYMAPEQADPSLGAQDHRADIYSLGAILYHGLTGRRPFASTGGLLALLTRIVQDAPTSPRALNPRVFPGLEAVCLEAMAKAPDDRYPTAEALAADLDLARTGGVPSALKRAGPAWLRVATVAVLAVAVALALVLGATAVSRRSEMQARVDQAAAFAGALDPWLEARGRGAAPVELAELSLLAESLPPEALALRRKLDACARLMRFRSGAPPGRASESGYGQLVEAIIQAEAQEHRRAEAALERAARMGAPAGLVAKVRRQVAEQRFLAVIRTAGTRTTQDALKRDLDEALAALRPATIESLGPRKREALEASVPSWEAEVRRLVESPVPAAGLAFVGRLQLVLRAGVACSPGGDIARLIDRVARAFPVPRLESALDAQVTLKRLAVHLAIYDLDPRPERAAPLGWQLLTSPQVNQYPELAHDPRFLMVCLRAGIRPTAPWLFGDRVREVDLKQIAALHKRHPRSAALAYLSYIRWGRERHRDTLATYEELVARLRGVIGAPFQDLHPTYLSDAMTELSHRLHGVAARAAERADWCREEAERWARRAFETAGEDRWAAYRAIDRLFWSVALRRGFPKAWEVVSAREAFFRAGKGVPDYFTKNAWDRYLGLAALAGNLVKRYAEVEELLRNELPGQQSAAGDVYLRLRSYYAEALLGLGRTEQAEQALAPTFGLETTHPHYVAIRVRLRRAQRRYAEAWELLRPVRKLHPSDGRLQEEEAELQKVAPR